MAPRRAPRLTPLLSERFFGNRATAVADINGDGVKDLVASTQMGMTGVTGSLRMRQSTGISFANTTAVSTDEFFGDRGTYFASVDDLPGDEAIAVNDNQIIVRRRTAGTPVAYGAREVWSGPFYPGARLTLTGSIAAVWRPTGGRWLAFKTSSSDVLDEKWGESTDIPVPGDYDRDGYVDLAVWRPSNGTWYWIKSSNGMAGEQQWGKEFDIPVPADYDGDGWIDIAIWRPSDGTRYVINSSGNPVAGGQWGRSGDVPVPGRYDSDGKVDFAVWRPAFGEWFVTNGVSLVQTYQVWGISSDIPVPGRYHEGDNRTDYTVFRPNEGSWHIRHTATGAVTTNWWGAQGDVPIPRKW